MQTILLVYHYKRFERLVSSSQTVLSLQEQK